MRSGSCPQQLRPPTEPSRSMWRAISTSLPIVAALILLPAIAFANPPDSSWIAGIYDGADSEDIVTRVYETVAINTAVLRHIAPLPGVSDISLGSIVGRAICAALPLNVALRTASDFHDFPDGCFTRGPRAPPHLYSPASDHVFDSLPDYTPAAARAAEAPRHTRVDHQVPSAALARLPCPRRRRSSVLDNAESMRAGAQLPKVSPRGRKEEQK
jgi:hypothetical protein